MDKKEKKNVKVEITNTDRTVGTILGAEITRKFGTSLEPDTYTVQCKGAGGQSFGAFIPKGLTLELEGDSNDYFGKGLSGGKLAVYAPPEANFVPEEKCHYRQCRSLRGHRRGSLYRRHGRRTLLCEKFRRNSGCGRRG